MDTLHCQWLFCLNVAGRHRFTNDLFSISSRFRDLPNDLHAMPSRPSGVPNGQPAIDSSLQAISNHLRSTRNLAPVQRVLYTQRLLVWFLLLLHCSRPG